MDITITISETAEQILREEATRTNREVAEFAGELLEKKVADVFPKSENLNGPHPLLKLAGMFNSGKTDTSSRASEILREAIRMPGGFGGREE